MEEWLSYRLGDFLMFSGPTYWRLFQLQNAALWPLPLAAPVVGGAALLLALRRPEAGLRLLALMLAAAWVLAGWSFVWQCYALINWGVTYLAPLFGAEALLLGWAAVRRVGEAPTLRTRGAIGVALLVWGLFLHPLAAPLFGRPLAQVEVAGIAPDPTAIATLGLALMLPSRALRLVAAIVPALWLGVSALTLWALEAPERALPVSALLLAAAGLAARPRRA